MLRAEEETRGPEMLRSEKLSILGLLPGTRSHACPRGLRGCLGDKHSEHR